MPQPLTGGSCSFSSSARQRGTLAMLVLFRAGFRFVYLFIKYMCGREFDDTRPPIEVLKTKMRKIIFFYMKSFSICTLLPFDTYMHLTFKKMSQ